MSSTALKNFTAFVFGLPNGLSFPAVTSKATSSGVQFSSFATWTASSRAGKSFAAHVAIAACVMSSVIRQSDLGIGILQAIPSGPPPARALRARAGGQALPGPISQLPQSFGVLSVRPQRIVSLAFYVQHRGTKTTQARPPDHARTDRGGYILNATHHGKSGYTRIIRKPHRLMPRHFRNPPVLQLSSRQRLSPFASSTLMREMTESDSVVSSAIENLLISYELAPPRHLHT
jgi:hypothetical protein